ncbi:hypothetical protein [Citrobacter sp. Cf081]|uniref:hypothetical protein n=1 Tax=Citrobacter sp. Cf081 TaxID=2985052 RepID=UPI002577DD70|nr:hypothetical protein [Citrobacter sp. Cf081]MDM3239334.1 hypothetical protein [Citrobacter sp. Cf081]
MKYECKILKFNFLLIIIVAVLLIIAILVGVRILFHGSKGYEWVTVAGTWISALGTLGTLWVAYKAFKAAPHWFETKNNEVGFNHVSAIMAESDEISSGLIRLYFDILAVGDCPDNKEQIKLKVESYVYKTLTLKRKLNSCKRWKITPHQELYGYFSLLRDFCNTSFYILHKGAQPELCDRLTNQKNDIERLSSLFSQDIGLTFTFPQ